MRDQGNSLDGYPYQRVSNVVLSLRSYDDMNVVSWSSDFPLSIHPFLFLQTQFRNLRDINHESQSVRLFLFRGLSWKKRGGKSSVMGWDGMGDAKIPFYFFEGMKIFDEEQYNQSLRARFWFWDAPDNTIYYGQLLLISNAVVAPFTGGWDDHRWGAKQHKNVLN